VKYPPSLRNVEDLLHERGIDVWHETVRQCWNRFSPTFAVLALALPLGLRLPMRRESARFLHAAAASARTRAPRWEQPIARSCQEPGFSRLPPGSGPSDSNA